MTFEALVTYEIVSGFRVYEKGERFAGQIMRVPDAYDVHHYLMIYLPDEQRWRAVDLENFRPYPLVERTQ